MSIYTKEQIAVMTYDELYNNIEKLQYRSYVIRGLSVGDILNKEFNLKHLQIALDCLYQEFRIRYHYTPIFSPFKI